MEIVAKAKIGHIQARKLLPLGANQKNLVLSAIADELGRGISAILSANARDCEKSIKAGVNEAFIDRLTLTRERIVEIIESLEQLTKLSDPIGTELSKWTLPNGLIIRKVRVPIGLIAMIYEARPNVTVDAAALCLKTGNAVLLRGSSSALETNHALVTSIQTALESCYLPREAVQLIEDCSSEALVELLKLNRYIDLIIPRGGADLIRYVVEHATVPVLETGAGNCHLYIDKSANYEMAEKIAINAKTQRPSVCNAIETLLIQRDWAHQNLSALLKTLHAKGVAIRGCSETQSLFKDLEPATEEDWKTEFLDLILATKVLPGVEAAVEHINTYGTRHSEAIITEDQEAARYFMENVDAAAIYHNASTRFTDGFQFGFGAEIGISTQKLHARGPVALPELTTYKYLVTGTGQVRS